MISKAGTISFQSLSNILTGLLVAGAAALITYRIVVQEGASLSGSIFSVPPMLSNDDIVRQDITVFNEVELSSFQVVTGHEYETLDQPRPSRQFCYATAASTDNPDLLPTVHFASIEGDAQISHIENYEAAMKQLAAQSQALLEDLLEARESCHWFRGHTE